MNAQNIIYGLLLAFQGFNFNIVTGKSFAPRISSRATCEPPLIEGDLGLCFICDANCIKLLQASSYKEKKDAFFDDLAEFVTAKFSFTKIRFLVQKINYENFDRGSEMHGYQSKAKSGYEISETNSGFWSKDRRAYYQGAPYFCDAAFLFTNFAAKASGAAYKGGICTDYSYGFLIFENNPDRYFDLVATSFTHEIGHLFGMHHDGGARLSAAKLKKYGSCKEVIGSECSKSKGLMSPSVEPGMEFSKCSKALFTYWAERATNPNPKITGGPSRSCIRKPVVGSGMAE